MPMSKEGRTGLRHRRAPHNMRRAPPAARRGTAQPAHPPGAPPHLPRNSRGPPDPQLSRVAAPLPEPRGLCPSQHSPHEDPLIPHTRPLRHRWTAPRSAAPRCAATGRPLFGRAPVRLRPCARVRGACIRPAQGTSLATLGGDMVCGNALSGEITRAYSNSTAVPHAGKDLDRASLCHGQVRMQTVCVMAKPMQARLRQRPPARQPAASPRYRTARALLLQHRRRVPTGMPSCARAGSTRRRPASSHASVTTHLQRYPSTEGTCGGSPSTVGHAHASLAEKRAGSDALI